MDDILAVMKDLGFSDYEARAYTALLQRNPLNGYELARLSEIPRGNIYAMLQRLEERNAVVRVNAAEAARYAPVSPHALLRRLTGRFQRSADAAERLLSRVAAPEVPPPGWNMGGYEALLEHAHSMREGSEKELLLAVWPEEAKALAGEVSASAERGVSVRTLCLTGCPQECGACRGHVHRFRMQAEGASRWLVVVPDGGEVLAGEIQLARDSTGDANAARAVRTRHRLLVDLIASYIRHSCAAGLPDFNPALDRLLQNQADIGNAIKPYYGSAAGDQLTALLRSHIVIAGALLADAKSGNSTAFAADKARWYANADDIAAFLHNANPENWPLADMQTMMHRHLDLTLQEAPARLSGNWQGDIAAYDSVHLEILQMADMLSQGIVEQFPQKFRQPGDWAR